MARQRFAQATAGLLMQPGLHLLRPLLLPEMAKQEGPSEPELLAPLARANLETLLAMQLLPEMVRRKEANRHSTAAIRRSPEANLMAIAMQQGLPAMLQENLPGKATQLLLEMVRPVRAKRPLRAIRRLPDRMEQHLARVRLLAARAKPQDLRRRRVERFPVPPARARRCL